MSKLKVAIIGCGNIFPMHAQSIVSREDAELVAVCDVKQERAEEKAKIYQCGIYTDYMEMFEKEKIDVLHICLPHHLHAPVTIEAAKRKIHILTEKPMSIHYNDAKAMVETAKENEVTLGVIFQNRYNPGSQLIKRMLDNGELGTIKSGKLSVTWEKEGGGVIIDQAIHTMDLMRWFIADDIKYVDASISNRAHEMIEVEDAAEGVVAYKNGIVTAFHAINYYTYDAPVEIELHCEKGIAKMIADRATVRLLDGREFIADNNPQETFDYENGVKGYWGVSHVKQINNFYDSLAKGIPLDITGEDALKTQEMICAVYESGKKKERVYFKSKVETL